MVFLIDADLPRAVARVVRTAGYQAIDVRDIGLGTADDHVIAEYALQTQVGLISGDFGFADIRNYPPENYHGIVVLEPPSDAHADLIAGMVANFLTQVDVLKKLSGRLAIVSVDRIRLRPK